jgi:hypothetical protein
VDWNLEAINAAQTAIKTVSDAVDSITIKASHLESLFVLLAHSTTSGDLPAAHRENVCMLGATLAVEIRVAAVILA